MWATARKAAEMLQGTLHNPRHRQPERLLWPRPARADGGAGGDAGAHGQRGGARRQRRYPASLLCRLQRKPELPGTQRRLGPSQSLLGTMLGIKAMLMMEDGRLMTQEKVQTREEVVEKLREFVTEFASVQ
jgi:hypothetical protein